MRGIVCWVIAALPAVIVLGAGCAHRTEVAAVPPLKVGEAITVGRPIAVAALERDPAQFVGQTVRLEGTVASVCQGKGCWVEVQGADGGKFMARSMDDSVLLPTDCAGRKIVVQGTVIALTPQPEHAAEAEAAGHVCPQPSYLVSTQGVELYPAPGPRPQSM